MDYVVVDHHYDTLRDMYVLTLGHEELREVPVLDEEGNHVRGEDREVENPKTGEPMVVLGEPLTEVKSILVGDEDIAFSGSDPKWQGMEPEEIAREQRKAARAALRKRDREAAEAAARLQAMPGVGDAL